MKKIALLAISAVALAASSFASVTINFGLGEMYGSADTSSAFPLGGRINILALTSGTWTDVATKFSNLTGSWTPANSVLVASFGSNNSDGPGTVGTSFTYSYSGAFAQGNPLLLVAYPTLNMSSSAPGNNTPGFFFRTDSIIDGSEIAWVAPADGTWTLGAYTLDLGGSVANDAFTSGDGATGGNGFTTVPEPSTYALLGMSALGLGGYMVRRRRR